eukprot:GDKH01019117.1.p4 GENE.GDKH01019117.1~~GDKH01019117.1.p4  ORF type:complete len:76 (-),score=11.89 GDKH01019117.1:169-396(-)
MYDIGMGEDPFRRRFLLEGRGGSPSNEGAAAMAAVSLPSLCESWRRLLPICAPLPSDEGGRRRRPCRVGGGAQRW